MNSSLGDIRQVIVAATERTDAARGYAAFAYARLEEASRLFAGLSDSAADLPRGDLDRARRDLDEVQALIQAASTSLSELDARL